MVMTYVAKHGGITRREAAELCRLSPDQAGRLLGRLRDKGALVRVGSNRARLINGPRHVGYPGPVQITQDYLGPWAHEPSDPLLE